MTRSTAPALQPWPLRLWYGFAFPLCLFVFGSSCLLWGLAALVLRPLLPEARGQRIGQFAIMAGFRWSLWVMRITGVLRVDFSAVDALRGERGLLLAANHPSMLDAVLLISRLPRVVCITKATLWDNAFLGPGIRMAGYIRNDAPLAMMRRAAAAVRGGATLLIFPEGSRTEHKPLDPFHRSFGVLARQVGAPVQTVLIEADSPYLQKGWPLLRRPVLPLVFRLRLGERFAPEGEVGALTRRIEAHVRASLA
ncbi:lysophospholipid acyltransferase family protein [Sabulicella glaciei]|uniref:1-acyl-sn-glycerol-3-phosphate acyltransferase n=1 Tax=Sabulicella glaciei TaxID=2984948 RepID=A0ABT3NY56_9PROT|nr:lysophospholipid acyltransferase family protein [Roseococcus sp. MDT2-1-1]MCW8086843.1 1-acyl-sn-glycerol-3-phosphate acyltransferase [Roseococcus sp. MDT2-1-1]